MRLSIGGYSFHRLLQDGKQDVFKYIEDCRRLGCTQIDPWNAQLAPLRNADQLIKAGSDPRNAELTSQDADYLGRVREAADNAGLPFGCIAVDGCHIYEPAADARDANRLLADRWLDVAHALGAAQVRIDAGGPEDMPDAVFDVIVSGYRELVGRAGVKGIEVLIENHWGPSPVPENLVRILDAVDGLGLLFDSWNWAPGMRERGWEMCAKYARSTHIKTFKIDEKGDDPVVDNRPAIRLLVDAGYTGCWGIESVPEDGDEYAAVEHTAAFIKRTLAELHALED